MSSPCKGASSFYCNRHKKVHGCGPDRGRYPSYYIYIYMDFDIIIIQKRIDKLNKILRVQRLPMIINFNICIHY